MSEPVKRKRGRPRKAVPFADVISIADYENQFIQHTPWYAVKGKAGWKSVPNESGRDGISRYKLLDFLDGKRKRPYGTLGKWFPSFCILDFDDLKKSNDVSYMRDTIESLGLNDRQYHIYTSESDHSYHAIFKVAYKDKPPTLKLLKDSLKPWADSQKVEMYPQVNHAIRVPFSPIARCVHPEVNLATWREKYYWYDKLAEYDLAQAPRIVKDLFPTDSLPRDKPEKGSAFSEGRQLLDSGLYISSSRNDAQFKVLYYFFRKNLVQAEAEKLTVKWLEKLHNGYSREVNSGNWKRIKYEIHAQASRIWDTYILPDDTTQGYYGWITKADLPRIISLGKGSLVRTRFLFNMVRWYYPRRNKDRIALHTDVILGNRGNEPWSSRGDEQVYLKRMQELEADGILARGSGYLVGHTSKSVKLKWDFGSADNALLMEDRPPVTLEDSLAYAYPELADVRGMLVTAGMRPDYASAFLNEVQEKKLNKGDSILDNIMQGKYLA